MKPIRVSIIEYANTIPFIYGLTQNTYIREHSVFTKQYPSLSAQQLLENSADISIMPIAAIPEIPGARIISDFCIAAKGHVASVLLCSTVPIEDIKTIKLDYQSRTSNILVQILAKKYWNISPLFIEEHDSIPQQNIDAYVLIGDKALTGSQNFLYVYDIATAWYKLYNTACVFACWVANKDIPQTYLSEFEKALQYGTSHISESVASTNNTYSFNVHEYLQNNIIYRVPNLEEICNLFYKEMAELQKE